MNTQKPNKPKKTLDKIFWFLIVPWLLLLLLIALIAIYQKEGIIHQDDLGNTLFSRVEIGTLLFIVGWPLIFYFLKFGMFSFFEKIKIELPAGFDYLVVLPLSVLICVYFGINLPYWTSLKFDNETKVLSITDYSLSEGNQKLIVPYHDLRFSKYSNARYNGNLKYIIKLEYLKEKSKQSSEPMFSTDYGDRQIYSTSFFRFFYKRQQRDNIIKLFRSLTKE